MSTREEQEEHFVLISRHIDKAKTRIARQQQLLQLREQGQAREETKKLGQELLSEMLDSLALMRRYREQILNRLEDLDELP